MEQAVNTFGKGLVTDYNPLLAPENTLTDALNATFVTMNGNEAMLQNDMGNGRVETAFLPSGFVPVGIKEHGGIIYVASHNPLTGESLVGSFPSPERNIDSREVDEKKEGHTPPTLRDIVNRVKINDNELWYINGGERERDALTETIPLFNGKILNPGDKFAIVTSTSENISDYLSHCYNTRGYKVDSPKLSESEISVLVLDSTKNLSDITDTLIRRDEDEDEDPIDLNELSEEFKRNYKYFIWDDFNVETQESEYFKENAIFEDIRKVNKLNLNTFLNKFSGSLFLSRKYNIIDHIDYNNVKWESSTGDPTVVKGTLSFDLIYYYNCPDGFYYDIKLHQTSRIKWKKGNWQIGEPNSNDSSQPSSPINLNFDGFPDCSHFLYCPNYDISTGLYKFVIPYKLTLKLNSQQKIEILENQIHGSIISKNSADNVLKEISNYNYKSWIGLNYKYSIIQGSNIEANYDKGLCTFTITPKMYYTKPLEDLAISFTTQLGQEVTPEPEPTPEPPTPGEGTLWENSKGFGYFWYSKKGVNNYVLLFKESYLTEKRVGTNELKYTINLVFYDYDYKERKLYKHSIENLSSDISNWNDVILSDNTYLKKDNENIKSYWRNIASLTYFGYVEINDNTIELIEGQAEPSGKYTRFWIFPKNIALYTDLTGYKDLFLTDGKRDRTKDTFDVLYTTDFSKDTPQPTNTLSASYYITGNTINMDLGYTLNLTTPQPLYRLSESETLGNIRYIFAESVIPQSICLVIKQSIISPVLHGLDSYFMIKYPEEEALLQTFNPNKDYFYPCVYKENNNYELLIPKILNSTLDSKNISITNWWKSELDAPPENLNFLTKELGLELKLSLQLYVKADNYTNASTQGFEITQNVNTLIDTIESSTLTESPTNCTIVN